MQRDEIRLECLKLAHRHDRAAEVVVTHAKEYEDYVLGGADDGTKEKVDPDKPEKRRPGRPPKLGSGVNSDFMT